MSAWAPVPIGVARPGGSPQTTSSLPAARQVEPLSWPRDSTHRPGGAKTRHKPKAPGTAAPTPAPLCSGFLQRGHLNSPKDQLLPQVNPQDLSPYLSTSTTMDFLPPRPPLHPKHPGPGCQPSMHPSRSGFPHTLLYTSQLVPRRLHGRFPKRPEAAWLCQVWDGSGHWGSVSGVGGSPRKG